MLRRRWPRSVLLRLLLLLCFNPPRRGEDKVQTPRVCVPWSPGRLLCPLRLPPPASYRPLRSTGGSGEEGVDDRGWPRRLGKVEHVEHDATCGVGEDAAANDNMAAGENAGAECKRGSFSFTVIRYIYMLSKHCLAVRVYNGILQKRIS